MMVKVMDGIIRDYDPSTKALLNDSSIFIEQVVLYGLYLIDIILTSDKEVKKISTRIVILMLRDMLENMDSVGILMKNGCTQGMIPLLRTILELYLSILFVIADDSEDRAITYDVCYIYQKIEAGEFLRKQGLVLDDDDGESIRLLKERLKKPGYAEVSMRWEKYKANSYYPPKWYQITKVSCKSIKKIAERIGKVEIYNIVYNYFSMYVHGDLSLCGYNYQDEKLRITPIRSPYTISLHCKTCFNLAADIYGPLVEKYLSSDDSGNFYKWYLARVEEIDQITSAEVIIKCDNILING